jgi:hypothetical protein
VIDLRPWIADLEPASSSKSLAPAQPQISMILSTPCSLYTVNPRVHSPYTQPAHVYMHPIHRQPAWTLKNKVFCESETFAIKISDIAETLMRP